MIELDAITKVYQLGETQVHALNQVSFRVERGEMVAIMGPSGSGKSTLLNILGCLDEPSSGTYRLDGLNVENMGDDELAEIRNRRIGFVFQQFNLLARTSALENVILPLEYAGVDEREARERAQTALNTVGLGERIHHRPNELSGGQQQRVAIARALVTAPAIILADEPTGNLDSKTSTEIIRLFQQLHRVHGQTIIYVTHDPFTARHTQRVLRVADGQIVEDERVERPLEAGAALPSELALADEMHHHEEQS
ncbi:MAG: ABC transporter ATP-binding protein [Ardenticatenales bacterium]|nr:ABC transporter ATP-binding protein [Ardenticatenales bacterium]